MKTKIGLKNRVGLAVGLGIPAVVFVYAISLFALYPVDGAEPFPYAELASIVFAW